MPNFLSFSYGAGLTSMSLLKFSLATFLGMLPLTFIYVSFGTAVLAHREVAAILGLTLVAAFFLLPRWIERYDLLGLKKYFRHSEAPFPDDHPAR